MKNVCFAFVITILPCLLVGCSSDSDDVNPGPKPSGNEIAEYNDSLQTEIYEIDRNSAKARSVYNGEWFKNFIEIGHCWSITNKTPNISDSKADTTIQQISQGINFTSKLKDLEANTSYYVRAFARSKTKIVYGKIYQFKTTSTTTTSPDTEVPVVATLFLRKGLYLIAIDPATGKTRWALDKVYSEGNTDVTLPAVSGNLIYVPYINGLQAYNITTGKMKWQFATPTVTTSFSPVVDQTKVYFSDRSNKRVYGIDATTGAKVWEKSFSIQEYRTIYQTLYNDILIVVIDQTLYALNTSDGSQIWVTNIGGRGLSYTNATVSNGFVIVSNDKGLVAFDVIKGTKKWEIQTGLGTPFAGRDLIYTNAVEAFSVEAFDPIDGTKKWDNLSFSTSTHANMIKYIFGGDGLQNISDPTLYASGYSLDLFNGDQVNQLYAIEPKTGKLKWSKTSEELGFAAGRSVVVGKMLYSNSADGCTAYDLEAKTILWKISDTGVPFYVDSKGSGYHQIESGMQP